MVCTLCGSPMRRVFDFGRQPLANKYPTPDSLATEESFPMEVLSCEACRNLELGTRVSRARMFEEYFYLSSVNPGLVRHFESLAEELRDARFVVDIGSNDGILLRPLKTHGVRALGIDPSINVAKIANDAGLETLVAFFDADTAVRVRREYGAPDIIVASSVFTHVENPHAFIEAVKTLLADDGVLVIEVEYAASIIRSLQFERFYLDRIFYYSLEAFIRLFERHDMHVADAALIDPHGGSLRIFVRKGAGVASRRAAELRKAEMQYLNDDSLAGFNDRIGIELRTLRERLEEYRSHGLRVAGYGAPARLSTITNSGKIGPGLISYVVDDSPLKQGRFTPGMHIPIVPHSHLARERPDVLIVFAHEYFDDIRKKTGDGYRFIFPIPVRDAA